MKTKINQLKKQFRNERGLTLVELLAVIVILAIVAVIAFVMIGNVMENARKDAHISNAQQLISAAKLYDATEKSLDSDEFNGEIDSAKLFDDEYLDKLIDPWTKSSDDYTGTVKKSGATYTVTIDGGSDECEINDADEEKLAGGRDEICD